ncbi:hypothetical protein CUR178_05444 [Leishmania enriettii]|uniref:Uncharacterized protein n=1 Tax=Leishmania enriettii TaxID=5663 RepID=A0A836KKB3_LEIEN|nr:hypothetical protein CUR178_05444 [Leishmania enriettii]
MQRSPLRAQNVTQGQQMPVSVNSLVVESGRLQGEASGTAATTQGCISLPMVALVQRQVAATGTALGAQGFTLDSLNRDGFLLVRLPHETPSGAACRAEQEVKMRFSSRTAQTEQRTASQRAETAAEKRQPQ